MTITTQHFSHPAADGQARPATSRAWRLSRTTIPLMGPADPATAVPLMGPADRVTAVPLMGPADPDVTPLMSPWR